MLDGSYEYYSIAQGGSTVTGPPRGGPATFTVAVWHQRRRLWCSWVCASCSLAVLCRRSILRPYACKWYLLQQGWPGRFRGGPACPSWPMRMLQTATNACYLGARVERRSQLPKAQDFGILQIGIYGHYFNWLGSMKRAQWFFSCCWNWQVPISYPLSNCSWETSQKKILLHRCVH